MKIRSVELVESSGPVSPRFQHRTRVHVRFDAETATITYEGSGAAAPIRGTHTRVCDAGETAAMRAAIEAYDLSAVTSPLASDDARKKRDGIAIQRLSIEAEEGSVMPFEWLRLQLEEPDNAALRAIVALVRGWVPM